ncbi:GNAT family N-acetyltransferase [Catellatospora sp. NPDC049609]|uniref:GNAT family N-acetyltransferase n=1 Tax=Catellatospora sp. NPDC049609 TaxID=3155505 RepID=UPI0034316186
MVTYRAATAADFDDVNRLVQRSFLSDDGGREWDEERALFEPERAVLAVDDDRVVGHVGTYSRELAVPGGVLPAGFVNAVVVSGTHRRRGVASTMLTRQLGEIRDRGEALAVLWASEGSIYGRYGYGMASRRLSFEIDRREVRIDGSRFDKSRLDGLSLRAGPAADFRADLMPVYERQLPHRPGFASRDSRWWDYRLADQAWHRDGAGPLQAVLCRDGDTVLGYALYRFRSQWSAGGPDGHVSVMETVATTPAAYTALWEFLLNVDLTRTVGLWLGAADEPLQYLVNDLRRLGMRLGDGLWVRLVDVPAALSARRYAVDVDVVLEVTDGLLPGSGGVFRLRGGRDAATCVPVTDAPDLRLDTATLSALYLGGNSLGALATAGRVDELRPGAVAATDPAFSWPRAPHAIEIF